MKKITLTMLILVAVPLVAVCQNAQAEPQRYSYHVWGSVMEEESRPVSKITVCFLAERPISGRIPCTKTGDDGSFAITVKDVPDKYSVCASMSDSPFILGQLNDENHRVTCSKPTEFSARDECRRVDLKFEPQ